jgi:hypothetical protein
LRKSTPRHSHKLSIVNAVTTNQPDIFNWINSDDTLELGILDYVSAYFLSNKSLIGLSGKCNICSSDMICLEQRQTEYLENIEKTLINKVFNQPGTFYYMIYL